MVSSSSSFLLLSHRTIHQIISILAVLPITNPYYKTDTTTTAFHSFSNCIWKVASSLCGGDYHRIKASQQHIMTTFIVTRKTNVNETRQNGETALHFISSIDYNDFENMLTLLLNHVQIVT